VSVFTLMDHCSDGDDGDLAGSDARGIHVLGFLAVRTNTMTLGLLVTGVTYRHPGLLAKIVTTLDVLSEGRANSASAPRGTNGSTGASACLSHPSPSASSVSRRRCRSSADVG